MKQVGALFVLLALAGVSGGAFAGYESGSELEADAPVTLNGRVEALVAKGLVSFVSDGDDNLLLSLTATELELRFVTVPGQCPPTSVARCPPQAVAPREPSVETHELRDVTLKVVRPLGAFKVVASNDPSSYSEAASFGTPGALVTTTSSGSQFTSSASDEHLSPFQGGWDTRGPTSATGAVYTAEAMQGRINATGGALRGLGGFQMLLQGASVQVTGLDRDGKPFDETFETPAPQDEADPVTYLDVQTPQGALNAASKAALMAHGVDLAEANGGAVFANAKGRVIDGDAETEYDGAPVTLEGPVALTLANVKAGTPLRLAFGLSGTLRISENLPPPEEDEPVDTAALVAAGAAGAGGMGLLAAIMYFWPRLKFAATLLFLPLYSRIERTAVLEHEKRDEIYGLIRATPGIHAHEIGEKARIGWGTTVYHLKLLENHNLIVSQKSGRYKRFFVNTGEYTKKKDVYGALRNETAKAVAQHIVEHPGVTQKELCAALGIQPSLASWHVEKLEGVELVKRVKDGRQVRYFAGPAWSQLNVRLNPTGGADGVAET